MNAPYEFSKEQQAYLQGLVMGSDVARKIKNLPVLSGSAASGQPATTTRITVGDGHLPSIHADAQQRFEAAGKTLVAEEKAKRDKNGLAMWSEIEARAETNEYPKGTDVFLTKYQGLFFVAPAQQSYMCRMRIPGGELRCDQLEGIADLSDRFANGRLDLTTRANLQLREIESKHAMEILMGLRDLGIVTLGSGADNVRNVTASTLSGIDPSEWIETLPLARRLHYHILNKSELYGLPRKFNIAFDGGGQVSSLAETNDVSFHAVRVAQSTTNACQTMFLLGLGGITGHGDFARPTGVVVSPPHTIALSEAILRVFIRHGDRTDRKKARLKYLLDAWGFERFLTEVEKELGSKLNRVAMDQVTMATNEKRWAHVDFHSQKQEGRMYVGVLVPVGLLTTKQARGIAAIARRYGSGRVRLTVWQNLIIPDLEESCRGEVEQCLSDLGLDWKTTSLRAGLVACTGNAGCKFAASDTKAMAMEIASFVEERLELNEPINIHVTGCHHSCAQHLIADIGLIATKIEVQEEMREGFHIFLGGKTGMEPKIAVPAFDSVLREDVPRRVLWILESYLRRESSHSDFATWAGLQNKDELTTRFETDRRGCYAS